MAESIVRTRKIENNNTMMQVNKEKEYSKLE